MSDMPEESTSEELQAERKRKKCNFLIVSSTRYGQLIRLYDSKEGGDPDLSCLSRYYSCETVGYPRDI